MDETDYESSVSSYDEEDERLRPLPSLVQTAPRPVIDVDTRITDNTVPTSSRSYSHVTSDIFSERTASSSSSNQHTASKATAEKSPEISSTSLQDLLSAQNVSAVDIDPAVIMYSKPFMKDASCQTIVTGDILSLNFFQGDGCLMDREWASFNDVLSILMRNGNSDLYI
ncbi:uncharacterized protein LOC126354534 [Schistocerca gregaria]|uniref:uncharacterized protein LOC126354534 n=1 Tax=Schistocerca gregaria TaxID=7010 RepID=UPI00211F11A2|nr:uncharacterized protein LOC126354534 [Schistocerca gregaria]